MNLEEIKAREQLACKALTDEYHMRHYIAGARTDIPALIAEVERLTAENAELKSNHAHWHKEEIEVQGQLWKENATLKDSLKATQNKLISAEQACREQKEEADEQIATLKSALKWACEYVNSESQPDTELEAYDYFIQQAKAEQLTHDAESEGKKC